LTERRLKLLWPVRSLAIFSHSQYGYKTEIYGSKISSAHIEKNPITGE